jgi:hypothetical protein
MAQVERGKGKRKQVIELSVHGTLLRTRENAGGDMRLPGFRRCGSEAAARAALEQEVRQYLDDGMVAGDDEARAIAAAMMPEAESAEPTLPLRRDFSVYNEATGFVITSRRMAGKTLDEGSDAWKKAITKGDLLPMTLVQDDPFLIRVVAGGPLNAQEEEEWVARLDWHLNISDGKLCITGGAVFSSDDYDDGDPYYEGYVAELGLPKGRYRATLYTHLHSINGGGVMDHLAGGAYGSGEEPDAWWARTRDGEPKPSWDDEELIGFLLHLEPIEKAPKQGLAELPEEGWFGGAEGARKPERCPRGLVGRDVVRRKESSGTGWTYVRDVAEMMEEHSPKALRGGTVKLPASELALLARLAWFGSRNVVYEVRLGGPDAAALAARAWPDGVFAVPEGEVLRLLISSDIYPPMVLRTIEEIGTLLGALPDGTKIELLAEPLDGMPGAPTDAGRMRCMATVKSAEAIVVGAWPQVEAKVLEAALALAREVTSGTTLSVRDDAEGESILAFAKRNFGPHLDADRPKLSNGAIRTKEPQGTITLVGVAAFAVRFGDTWPHIDLGDDDDDDDDDGMFPTKPIQGKEIWRAPNGRVYNQTMATLVSQDVAESVKARSRAFVADGFKEVGDLVCDQYENVAARAYAKPGEPTWGVFYCAAPDEVSLRLVSQFEGGGMLVTSVDRNARDDEAKKFFHTGVHGANTRDLMDAHAKRLAELAATLGPSKGAVASQAGFAPLLDALLDAGV